MFEYTIEGIVTNGDGLALALYTSDQRLDESAIVKILDGKFVFKGATDYIKKLNVRFEDDIEHGRGYQMLSVYTEPGLTTVQFDVSGVSGAYRFSNFELINGPNNKLARAFLTECAEAIGKEANMVFGAHGDIDDKWLSIYAAARSRVLQVYDKYFAKDTSGIHLYLLKWMTDRLDWPGVYDKKSLSREEIDKIKDLFSKVEASLSANIDYQIVKATIDQLGKADSAVAFVDYELELISGEREKLSELIKGNKFTILDFWHSGCGPCRAFNKAMSAEYKALRKFDIAIVGINVDDSKVKWKSSTAEDSIPWPNLYAGRNIDILARYGIRSFPAILVYDKHINFIDTHIRNKGQLWSWLKSGLPNVVAGRE